MGNPRDAETRDLQALSAEEIQRLIHDLEVRQIELENQNEVLHRSNTFLQAVIDTNPELIVVMDRDYRVLLANRAARKKAGGQDPVAACLACHQLFHHRETPCPEDIEPCPLRQILTAKRPVTVEHTHYDADNNEIFVEIDAAPIVDGTGEVVQIIQTVRDITERKKAAEALQQSEQRFRSLVETTSDWIWEVDRNGVYTYASPKIKDLLGYEPEEILGKTAFDFMPLDEAKRVNRLFRENCESRQSFIQIENINLHKDGRPIMLETSGVPIIDHDGSLRGYRGVDRDITERKLAGEALRKSERKYRVLFERSADATLIIDDNKFVDCNDAVVKMLRYSNKADLLSTHPSELSPETQPDGMPSFEKANEMMAIAFKKGSHRFEWDHKRADGEVFPVEVLLTAIPSEDGRILHVVWRDITDRKRAEKNRNNLIAKLESQNAELERFTYTVSHDLKSPLITLKGFMGVLKEDLADGDGEAIEDDLTRMGGAADKMARLLDELLELSRIGRVVNPPEDVTLGEIAGEAVELVGGRITQGGVQVEIAPDAPVIFGDHSRLVEVLQNLIENAVKWTANQPDPRIIIGARQDNGETVCYVRDNGMGIDPRYHEKIFGLFEKLDSKSEGSGVGLALVKRIVEVHGGRIWVESEGVGQGSTFCFTLPQRTDSTKREEIAK